MRGKYSISLKDFVRDLARIARKRERHSRATGTWPFMQFVILRLQTLHLLARFTAGNIHISLLCRRTKKQACSITDGKLPGGLTLSEAGLITLDTVSIQLEAFGTAPIKWTLKGGNLPGGLVPGNSRKISGKPTVYGVFNVKVKAENGAGITEKTLQLEIKAIVPKLSGSLAKPTLNEAYSSSLKVTGSTPVTWSIQGNLLGGLTLDSSTGSISGTPTS